MQDQRDEGLGLTEVMIAMLLLAIIMMAVLTLVITSFQAVAKNSTRSTAAQLATARVEAVRSVASDGDCANVIPVGQASETTTDPRGVDLTVTGVVTNCVHVGDPHSSPVLATVNVTVTTTDARFTNPIAETESDIFVKFDAAGSGG